jgi:hypothetical protein
MPEKQSLKKFFIFFFRRPPRLRGKKTFGFVLSLNQYRRSCLSKGLVRKLNRFKKKLLFFFLLLSAPSLGLAQIAINSISVSSTSPVPGTVLSVTISYCCPANATPFWMVALNPSSTTIQSCPALNQELLVDGATTPIHQSTVSSGEDDTSDPGPNQGYPGVPVPNTPPACPYTQVFNVTIPGNLNGGTYYLDVSLGENYVQCAGGVVAHTSATLVLPYPPPNITLIDTADGSTANPGDLVLFRVDYTYVNTGNVTVTETIPAGTALASGTGSISPGGVLNGSTITWTLPASQSEQSGEVWFLTKVNAGVPVGTVINNSATATSGTAGTVNSNQAQVNIGSGGFSLLKSESAAVLNTSNVVTYTLSYQVSGESLQDDDTLDNNSIGTSNASILGYDGTTAYVYTNTGGMGGFTVEPDPAGSGNNVIEACSSSTCNSAVTDGNYPTLLRSAPAVNLCNNFMVEGDMYIPSSSAAGADATMVIADNLSAPNVNDAYMLGISLDCGPGNFFLQKNNSATDTVTYPAEPCNNAIGTTITAGVWYTAKVLVTYNAGTLNFQAKVWPRGTPEPTTWSINYTDNAPLPCTAVNGGTYLLGWQADGSSPTDDYSNLKLYGPSPVVNPRIWDTLPAGENSFNYINQVPTQFIGNYLEWDLGGAHPVTTYNLTGAITVSASVSCGTAINQAAVMGDNGVSLVESNAVTLTENEGCITNTPTQTPTITPTGTPKFTSTPTQTPTITFTPTVTPTPIPAEDEFYVAQNVYNATTDQPVSIFVGYSQFPGAYSLWIYNSAGEHIRTLDSQNLTGPINQSYFWDGKNKYGNKCASGVYILYLVEPFSTKVKRLVLIR